MPVINIQKKQSNSVTNVGSSSNGDSIVDVSINGASFISEDLSKQISPGTKSFTTTYQFLKNSLEVYLNGMILSAGIDFEENLNENEFLLVDINIDYAKILNSNSYVFVKYIKK